MSSAKLELDDIQRGIIAKRDYANKDADGFI
jgi:hypothetical protein